MSASKPISGKLVIPGNHEQPREYRPSLTNEPANLCGIVYDESMSTHFNNANREIRECQNRPMQAIAAIPELKDCTEFCVFAYGGRETTTLVTPFTPASQFKMPKLPKAGGTYIYEGYARCMAEIIARMKYLEEVEDRDVNGMMMLYFSDWRDEGHDQEWRDKAFEAKHIATELGVNVILLGAGNSVDEAVASELAQPDRQLLRLARADFPSFFNDWLPDSIVQVSQGFRGNLKPFNGNTLRIDRRR